MPFDGSVIASVVHELERLLVNGRIDKIIQPEADEVIIAARAGGTNHKLLLTASAQAPRVHLTTQAKNAPLTAPQFCMVLRKHLSGGRILAVRQPDFERIVAIDIENRTEMGDASQKRLIIEIMGKHSNIILLDHDERVLDAIKHVPPSVSSVRTILPGARYEPPPTRGKVNPLTANTTQMDTAQHVAAPHSTGATDNPPREFTPLHAQFHGISPALGEEILLQAVHGTSALGLTAAFADFTRKINSGDFDPHIYYDDTGKALDITPWPFLLHAQHRGEAFDSASAMLERFYMQRDADNRLQQRTADLRKLLTTQRDRARNKSFAHEKTLAETQNRDTLRIKGELLTAYLHKVERGASTVTLDNFYDNNAPMEINLDPTLSPSENAQRYFRQYNKQKRAAVAVVVQIEQNNADLAYLESVLTTLDNAQGEEDINEIRAELAEQGFAKRRPTAGKSGKSNKKPPKARPSKPLHYTSTDGFDIYVGKNNTQNDTLTLRTAHATDLWLHTKDIPGSHVILVTRGAEPPETTLREAANLAAWYSRARASTNVPVDYVARKHVRKPAGAKPGFVIYDYHKTVYVTPVEPSEGRG
ncbi:MAG: NFACT family protein [Defluviitaleaceae bacterium]|nr:NFACT family protein [Defluviitaleaceae bacterium]